MQTINQQPLTRKNSLTVHQEALGRGKHAVEALTQKFTSQFDEIINQAASQNGERIDDILKALDPLERNYNIQIRQVIQELRDHQYGGQTEQQDLEDNLNSIYNQIDINKEKCLNLQNGFFDFSKQLFMQQEKIIIKLKADMEYNESSESGRNVDLVAMNSLLFDDQKKNKTNTLSDNLDEHNKKQREIIEKETQLIQKNIQCKMAIFNNIIKNFETQIRVSAVKMFEFDEKTIEKGPVVNTELITQLVKNAPRILVQSLLANFTPDMMCDKGKVLPATADPLKQNPPSPHKNLVKPVQYNSLIGQDMSKPISVPQQLNPKTMNSHLGQAAIPNVVAPDRYEIVYKYPILGTEKGLDMQFPTIAEINKNSQLDKDFLKNLSLNSVKALDGKLLMNFGLSNGQETHLNTNAATLDDNSFDKNLVKRVDLYSKPDLYLTGMTLFDKNNNEIKKLGQCLPTNSVLRIDLAKNETIIGFKYQFHPSQVGNAVYHNFQFMCYRLVQIQASQVTYTNY